jgi:hypothetical protein
VKIGLGVMAGLLDVDADDLRSAIEKVDGLGPGQSVPVVSKSLCDRREVTKTMTKNDVIRKHASEIAAVSAPTREQKVAAFFESSPAAAEEYSQADPDVIERPVIDKAKAERTPAMIARDAIVAKARLVAPDGLSEDEALIRYLDTPQGHEDAERYSLIRG